MSVPDYAEMGRELEANRDATLVNAANRGVKYHEELEAAERKLAHLQTVLDERLRRIECLNSKLQHAYPALQSAKTEESTKALAEMDRITGEYQQSLAQIDQPQEYAKTPRLGTNVLTKDLWWCECGRGLGGNENLHNIHERWAYCPHCGSSLNWVEALREKA
jgi:hypothetical protein